MAQTLAEAAAEFNRALRELNRIFAAELTPIVQRLADQLAALNRQWYLARVKRLLVWFGPPVFVVAVVAGWWLS